jgi:hypothetical protein
VESSIVFKSSDKGVHMSAAAASGYVRRMVELETRGSGDTEGALRRLEARFGLPYWSLWHLRRGAAKTVEAGLFARIRGAYLSYCEQQVAALQHEIFLEKAADEDADLADLEVEAQALAEKIAAARRRIGGVRR